jgi:hypothetical protein
LRVHATGDKMSKYEESNIHGEYDDQGAWKSYTPATEAEKVGLVEIAALLRKHGAKRQEELL